MLGHKFARGISRQGLRPLAAADPGYAAELNQVWTNLIDNAADAHGR